MVGDRGETEMGKEGENQHGLCQKAEDGLINREGH